MARRGALGIAVIALALAACHETFTAPDQPDLYKRPHDFGLLVEDLSTVDDLSGPDDLSATVYDLAEPKHDLSDKKD